MRELIDEKVNDNYIFVWKNKIRAETRVQFWSCFIILLQSLTNEQFSSGANQIAKTLNFCFDPLFYKNLPLYFVLFRIYSF